MKGSRSQLFNPSDTIKLLSDDKTPRCAYEREVALFGLIAWMNWPDDPRLVRTIQTIAAAHYAKINGALGLHDPKLRHPLTQPDLLIDCLLSYVRKPFVAIGDLFESAEWQAEEVGEIVSFFMLCPASLKPSMNKALYFIDGGGFVPLGLDKADQQSFKRSIATSKTAWASRKTSAPFVYVCSHLGFQYLLRLSPDKASSLKRASSLVNDKGKLLRFFGYAKYSQNILLQRLDRRALAKCDFATFSETLEALDPAVGPFDADQIELLKSYRAPQLI